MDKHEALEALEKAHKIRKHADKLEREAYEILDEKKEHEATASSDNGAIALGNKHSLIAALHRHLKFHHKNLAAASTGATASKHATLSAKHAKADSAHTAKSEAALRPHYTRMSRNLIHEKNEEKARKHVGDAIGNDGTFKPTKARTAIAHLSHW